MAKSIQFVPSVCKVTTNKKTHEVVQPTFSGTVTLRKLTCDEKYALLESCGFEVDEADGETTVKTPKGKSPFSTLRTLISMSKGHYEAVDLTRLADGQKFTSFDDMDTEDDCHPIMTEVANRMVAGFQVGNEPKPQ